MSAIRVQGKKMVIAHADKVLFPQGRITKEELAAYYRLVAARMVPYTRNRPLMMARYPDGIARPGFYQKETPEGTPRWVATVRVAKEGGSVRHIVANNAATLIYLADLACITPHLWLSTVGHLNHPDQMMFDLDPSAGSFRDVVFVARALHALLDDLKMPSFLKTTGSRGLHVVVPLKPEYDFDAVRECAHVIASTLAAAYPNRVTVEPRKARRGTKAFLDVLRNGYAQTAVAPFAVRARPHAPIAAPVPWMMLDDPALRPDRYTLRNIRQYLREHRDPWKSFARSRIPLSKILNRARR